MSIFLDKNEIERWLKFFIQVRDEAVRNGRHKLRDDVQNLKREWSVQQYRQAREKFDLAILNSTTGSLYLLKIRPQYWEHRKRGIPMLEEELSFDFFIAERYLGKSSIDYVEEAFAEINANGSIECGSYGVLCREIEYLQQQLLRFPDVREKQKKKFN